MWVTIPFDPESSGAQPETLARVVRCQQRQDDSWKWNVAMQFEGAAHAKPARQNGNLEARKNQNGSGTDISLPIRVRPEHVPWHEEAMTLEVSRDKLKFVTNREYSFRAKPAGIVRFGERSAVDGRRRMGDSGHRNRDGSRKRVVVHYGAKEIAVSTDGNGLRLIRVDCHSY